MKHSLAVTLSIVASLAFGLVPSPSAEAAHPFYEEQLRRGAAALDRGDAADAEVSLRLAAFGLLDEPPALAAALVRLALAQQALGTVEPARETVARVLELEERFSAFSAAALDDELRQRFEALLAESVPAERLTSMPAFRAAAHQRIAAEIDRLPPRQRAERLEQLVAAEPREPQWPLRLARLEHAAGRYERAIALSSQVLALTPDDASAYCVRGLAHAGREDCPATIEDLARCDRTAIDASIAWTQLDCLVEGGRWSEAETLLAALPATVRAERRTRKIERRIERSRPPEPEPAAAVADTEPGGIAGPSTSDSATAEPSSPDSPTGAPPPLPAEDVARLERARQALDRARTVADLAQAATIAADVATRHPESLDANRLAGEIAYRGSRWSDAASYFGRGGLTPGDRPELLFYYAVSLWESDQPAAAAAVLEAALPRLRRTEFVDGYITRILGPER